MPTVRSLRDRLPAALAAVLCQIAIVAVFLNAIPKFFPRTDRERETIIPLTPEPKLPPRAARRATPGPAGVSRTFYHFEHPLPPVEAPALEGLNLALSSCAPEKLEMESNEVRAACRRIGFAVAANPGAVGLTPDYKNGKRWERELLIKQTPLLLPCASPTGNPFETLFCIADVLQNGYDPDKMPHYSK
ncbi:MAG: hypothetical protein KGM97_05815 [Alphaproteobacteria bacterium]|nr:hypothetical protein [Alphaproteobacteria bacterium]MDE2630489.1 hypothetical protein [Alphaproteobacteria bacterium]